MKNDLASGHRSPIPKLRKHRRHWGLSAKELTVLLGLTNPAQLSKIEHGKRPPTVEVALASQALFGVAPAEMYPQLSALAEDRLMRYIAERHLALAHSITATGKRKRELYETALSRAVSRPDSFRSV
jgi:transcriptional regulator with XRE-family HTH domain